MSDFLDPEPFTTELLDEKGKKEQARLRKELGWDENGKRVAPAEPEPERETAKTAA